MKNNKILKYLVLSIAVFAFFGLFGCSGSSGDNTFQVGADFEGDYIHGESNYYITVSFKSGTCYMNYKHDDQPAQPLGNSTFTVNTYGNIILNSKIDNYRYFSVYDSGDFIIDNHNTRYDKYQR